MRTIKFTKEVSDLELDGLARVSDLKQSCEYIPDSKGIYVVLREITDETPDFLAAGPVREHKGKALDYRLDVLQSKWVAGTQIVYIGKSDSSLKSRINTYMRYGKGNDAAHRGGRSIWQLPDANNLIVGWKRVGVNQSARDLEKKLIYEFKERHGGKLPFANFTE